MRSNPLQALLSTSHNRPRAHSQPTSSDPPDSESESYTDIPPDTAGRFMRKGRASSAGVRLECEETVEAYQVRKPCGDVEEVEEVSGESEPSTPRRSHRWTVKSQSYLTSLLEKETLYSPNPFSLSLHQPHLTPLMRSILFDWMMEVCSEFTLKRETYYMSISYVDRFIDVRENVGKRELQLLGLSAMFIAAKTEEIWNPKITDFAKTADNGYSLAEIKEMELMIFRALGWRILPPTAFAWANVVMSLWDDYVLSIFGEEASILDPSLVVLFKQPSHHSYRRFRETMQILDLAFLDHNAIRYSNRHLVAGLMYLMVSKYFYETEYRLLTIDSHRDFTDETESLTCIFGDGVSKRDRDGGGQLRYAKIVQDIYIQFTAQAIEIHNIEEIYPTVAFLHAFLDFEATYELPSACTFQSKSQLESHYEDFLAYQTHNPAGLTYLSQKQKRK